MAYGQTVEWTLDNQSSHNINYIYLSSPDAEDWGEDILGEGYIVAAGESSKVTISDTEGNCIFDLQLIMSTKQVIEDLAVDLCGGSTYTLSDKQ